MRGAHPHPDAIADCVLSAFSALPQKYKPRRLADGRREWVPLAGVVLSRHPGRTNELKEQNQLRCVALATGMKCLPHSKVKTAEGCVLHDSHAEVLALRGFNRWLVDECADLARRGFGQEGGENWVRWRTRGREQREPRDEEARGEGVKEQGPQFELQEDVRLHMYCSEAPCGDASMELVMQEQEDDTPWERAPPAPPPSSTMPSAAECEGKASGEEEEEDTLLGRAHFSHLGIVRRKPARPDAPVTLSKSCSDKLALKQCTGLLSGLTARLVGTRGTWLSTVVLPRSGVVEGAVERAFGHTGRMAAVVRDRKVGRRWQRGGFAYAAFEVRGTGRKFQYARHLVAADTATTESPAPPAVPSNLATVCTPHKSEILINGVLQGRRQDDPRGASRISRRRMWEAVCEVRCLLGPVEEDIVGGSQTYAEFKAGAGNGRETVKNDVRALALKGWRRNTGDEGWRLDDVDGGESRRALT